MAAIYLIGARGSGKTTVGKALAKFLGWSFVDLDHFLVELQGQTIAEMVKSEGWPVFRQRESACLAKAALMTEPVIIATGGGIVLARENRALLQASSRTAWLKADPELLGERLAKDPLAAQRPSLTGDNIHAEAKAIAIEREPLYAECASHIFDASLPVDELCAVIAAAMVPGYQDS